MSNEKNPENVPYRVGLTPKSRELRKKSGNQIRWGLRIGAAGFLLMVSGCIGTVYESTSNQQIDSQSHDDVPLRIFSSVGAIGLLTTATGLTLEGVAIATQLRANELDAIARRAVEPEQGPAASNPTP